MRLDGSWTGGRGMIFPVSEERAEYLTEDERAILARLLEVFTWGQLLRLADGMQEALTRRYARMEIEVRNDRMFIWVGRSIDGGDVRR